MPNSTAYQRAAEIATAGNTTTNRTLNQSIGRWGETLLVKGIPEFGDSRGFDTTHYVQGMGTHGEVKDVFAEPILESSEKRPVTV
jgi:hypothetical protein